MSNMVVRTNIYALNSHRNMKNVGMQQKQASNRLSSGYRINSAADDAAGLAISENMRAQIRGLDQASRNAQDGQAMLLTTEGGLEEIGNQLQRVRELMVQASNDTNTQNQRSLIEQEISQLGREILSMQNRVEFNTNRVLAMGPAMEQAVITNASAMAVSAQNMNIWAGALNEAKNNVIAALDLLNETNVGTSYANLGTAQTKALDKAGQSVTALLTNHGNIVSTGGLSDVAFNAATLSNIANAGATSAGNLGKITFNGSGGTASAGTAITVAGPNGTSINSASSTSAAARAANAVTIANVGAIISVLQGRLEDINSAIDELRGEQGGDVMRSTFTAQVQTIRGFVNDDSSGANIAYFQVGANASQGVNFDFETVSKAVSAAGWTVRMLASTMSAPGAGSGIGNGVNISPFISALDSSINDISSVRANLGAIQNRMDYTMRSLDISSENLSDSESRVRNADIAKEMMKFTMSNVLQQASVSMLSQANQMPQNLLQLLR